jgi:hypothetical protein
MIMSQYVKLFKLSLLNHWECEIGYGRGRRRGRSRRGNIAIGSSKPFDLV